jgi:hypothetical protein
VAIPPTDQGFAKNELLNDADIIPYSPPLVNCQKSKVHSLATLRTLVQGLVDVESVTQVRHPSEEGLLTLKHAQRNGAFNV